METEEGGRVWVVWGSGMDDPRVFVREGDAIECVRDMYGSGADDRDEPFDPEGNGGLDNSWWWRDNEGVLVEAFVMETDIE